MEPDFEARPVRNTSSVRDISEHEEPDGFHHLEI